LLNPQKKQSYDIELRGKFAALKPTARRAASPTPAAPFDAAMNSSPVDEHSVTAVVSAAAMAKARMPQIEIATGSSPRVQRKQSINNLIPLATILVAVACVAGVAAWLLNKPTEVSQNQAASSSSDASVVPASATAEPTPEEPPESGTAAGDVSTSDAPIASATPLAEPSGAADALSLLPNEDNKASSSTETSDEQLKEKERESPVEGSESPDGAAVSEGSLDGSHADDRSSDDPEGDAPSQLPDPTTPLVNDPEESLDSATATAPTKKQDTRAAIPSKAAQAQAAKRLEDVYGAELAGAKSSESKVTLALKLLNEGIKSIDDRAIQYVILARSIELAADGEDLTTALRAADVLAEKFQFSSIQSKVDAAETVLKKVNTPLAVSAAIEESLALVDAAVAQDAFGESTRLLAAIRKSLRKAQQPSLSPRLKRVADGVRASEKEFKASRKAAEILETEPDDPQSNFVVGAYNCFYRHSWDDGLAQLKKSNDPDFRRVATIDLQRPDTADKQLAAGDQWWDLAKQAKGPVQRACEDRAVFWYEKAVARLSGLSLSKAQDRIFAATFGKTKLWTTNPKDGGATLGHADTRVTPEYTLELWFATTAPTGTLITKRQQEPEGSLTIVIQDGRLRGWANGSFYLVETHGDQTVNDGKWHHVAVVKTPGQLQLFVDGRAGGTASIRDEYDSQSPWTLGIHRINTSHGGPIDARYCRIRFSASARYTTTFKPDQRYVADETTVFLE
jgi:hypothetical protein